MEQKYCQSCGMPLTESSLYGTNKDQTVNNDFCIYCFKDGAFVQDMTMDDMILHCAQFVDEFNKDSEQKFTKEEAIAQMKLYFPSLKRWQRTGD